MNSIPIPQLSPLDLKRFNAKVTIGRDEDCWLWAAGKDSSGYGVFSLNDRKFKAHRIAVKVAGYSVPTKSVIDHICRNRACVNPAHLRTVDRFVNVHENSEALAHLNSLKTECIRGHLLSGPNLYVKPNGKRQCRACERARVARFRLDAKHESAVADKPFAQGDQP